MKNLILEHINNINYQPSTFEDLVLALEIDESDYEQFSVCLEDLINDYELFLNKKKAPLKIFVSLR